MPVTSVYRAGGGYGIVSDPGPTAAVQRAIPSLLPPILGNVLRVDGMNGVDSTASIGGLPYATIEAALSAATTGTTVWIMPGTYNISASTTAGLVIPDGVSIRGVSTQTVIINYNCSLNGGAAFTAGNTATGSGVRIEDITLNVTAQGDVSVIGILVPYPDITKIRTCVINVNASTTVNSARFAYGLSASTASVAGRSMTSINANGVPTAKMFSFNTVKGTTINVFSNGCSGSTGARRGILVSASTCVTCRDANIFIGAPTGANPGTGSYVGVETNDATNSIATVQLRNCSIGSCVDSLLANTGLFTASDVLQTTPNTVTPGTTKTGIILGAGTDLITKNAGGRPLTATTFPQTLSYNLKGTGTGWLSQGVQAAPDSLNNAPFTGQYFVTNTAASATDNITLNTTAGLSVGMPIRFGTALNTAAGIIDANTTYYTTKVTASAIQVATTAGGTSLASTADRTSSVTIPTITSVLPGTTSPTSLVSTNLTASGVTNQYAVTAVAASNTLTLNSTAGLVVGQPITFNNISGISGIESGTTYYIASVTATGITLRLGNPSGSAVSITAGAGTATITLPTEILTGSSSIGQYTVLATDGSNGLIMNSTSGLAVGLPISFASAIPGTTGIVAYNQANPATVYYIASVNATRITVTDANTGGTTRVLTGPSAYNIAMTIYPIISAGFPTASATGGTITTATPHNFIVGTILTFTSAFGSAAAGNYHVKTVATSTTFTIAAGPCIVAAGDAEVSIGSVPSGTVLPISFARYPVIVGTIGGGGSSTLTLASAGTVNLVPGMPITFGANVGTGGGTTLIGGANPTTYYVYQILTTNSAGVGTFNVTSTQFFTSTGGTPITLAGSSSSINYSAQTIPAASNNALNFITFPSAHNLENGDAVYFQTAAGGLTANTLYYVQNTPNSPSSMVSLMASPISSNGANMLTQTLTSFTNASISAVHTLQTGTITVPTTASFSLGSGPANFLVTGMPIVFGTSYGSGSGTQIVAGTVYYVYQVMSTSTFTVTSTLGSASSVIVPSAGGSSAYWALALTTVAVPSSPILTPASSNLLTFSGAHNLLSGDALVFNAPITTGSATTLAAGRLYYVINAPTTTQVMLSETTGGVAVPISTVGSVVTGVIAYYTASTGTCAGSSSALTITGGASNVLSPGMPIVLSSQTTGGLTQGNVGVNTVYYIASNPAPSATTFTIVDSAGAAISPSIETTSLLNYSAFSTGVQPQYFVRGSTSSGNTLTMNTTAGLAQGMPIQFGTAINGSTIAANTTYYVMTVTATTIQVSANAYSLSALAVGADGRTSSATIVSNATSVKITGISNASVLSAVTQLAVGNAIVLNSNVGPFSAGVVYYVQASSATTLSLSASPFGSAIATTVTAVSNLTVSATGYYTLSGTAVTSVATPTPAGLFTVSGSGAPVNALLPNSAILFTASPATEIIERQIYYVVSPGTTTGPLANFFLSLTPGGNAITALTTPTGQQFVVFGPSGSPTGVRIQTPSLLVGLVTNVNSPVGSGNPLVVTVYRTPATGGPTAPIASYTYTYNDIPTTNNTYFNTSQVLNTGDRLHVLASYQGTITYPRDITAQLIIV